MESSSSSYSSSSSMVEMEDIEIPEIDSAFLMSLLQDSNDQTVDQDDIRLMHVIQSLEAEISPIPVTYDDFSDTESSTASDESSGQSSDQMDGQDCFMEDDIDLSWIDMEMVASLDCGDTGHDMGLWCTDEELYNVDQYAQGYSYGVEMDQGYDYSGSSWQLS